MAHDFVTNPIDRSHLIARTCGPRSLQDGFPWQECFLPSWDEASSQGEEYLSVSWLAKWGGQLTLEQSLQKVRETRAARFSPKALFAVILVAEALDAVFEQAGFEVEVRPYYTMDDPSHAGIVGYDRGDQEAQVNLSVALARTVGETDWCPVYPLDDQPDHPALQQVQRYTDQ